MKKLREVLLILLSSDQPGEIAAAASIVRKELAKAGRDVHWLADQLTRIIEAPAVGNHTGHVMTRHQSPRGEWWDQLAFCMSKLLFLSEREAEFITSVYEQWTIKGTRWTPSAKQLRWLASIHEKLQAGGDPFGRW